MATKYTAYEAMAILNEGTDWAAIEDLGRRYPLLVALGEKALHGDADAVVEFLKYIPEYVTCQKVHKVMKMELLSDDSDGEPESEEKEEKPAPKRRARKAKEEPEPEPDSDDDSDDEDGKYFGKNAMELFKECKKRGIKAAPKKPAKFYIDLLEKDDATKDEPIDNGADDDDDDWDI